MSRQFKKKKMCIKVDIIDLRSGVRKLDSNLLYTEIEVCKNIIQTGDLILLSVKSKPALYAVNTISESTKKNKENAKIIFIRYENNL